VPCQSCAGTTRRPSAQRTRNVRGAADYQNAKKSARKPCERQGRARPQFPPRNAGRARLIVSTRDVIPR